MSREALKELIDVIPEKEIKLIYDFVIDLIPSDDPLPDESEAIAEAKRDTSGTIPHDEIDWD